MDGPCAVQLMTADTCVQADPASCACFSQPFNVNFAGEVSGAYRSTMAFEVPGTDAFCDVANESVCTQLDVSGSCCCQAEVHEFITCSFLSDYNPKFGAGTCPFSKCGAGGDEVAGGGSMMMVVVVIIIMLLCCCCCGGFYYRRRKNQRMSSEFSSKDGKETRDASDSWAERDIESVGDSRKHKSRNKSGKHQEHCNSDSDDSDTRRNGKRSKLKKKKGSKRGIDSDSGSDSEASWKRDKEKDKRKNKRAGGYGSDNSGSNSEESGTKSKDRRKKMTRRSSKKSLDSDSEEDSRRSDRRSKMKQRSSKKGLDSDSEDESASRRTKSKRRNTKRGFDDSDEESVTRRNKDKRKSNNRSTDESDEDSVTRREKQKKTVDQSVRQARTILKTVKRNEKDGGEVSVEVQQVMNVEMSALIAQLKEQKDEMERRLRDSEIEATKLRIEKEVSQSTIVQLETKKTATEHTLYETKKESKDFQANKTLEVANKEAEKIKVSAELEQVRKEREEMAKMIKKLEKAKDSMEGKLEAVQEEATVLRVENTVATNKMGEVEKDREELRMKLNHINHTRGGIETRLRDAEEEAKKLRSIKTTKTKEIREERSSTHVRKSYLDEMQTERKGIALNLKKIEDEKLQMMTMMDQLENSRHRLSSLIDEDEVNLTGGGDMSGRSLARSTGPRYTHSLATIQSPRNLGSVPTFQRRPSLNDLMIAEAMSQSVAPPPSQAQMMMHRHNSSNNLNDRPTPPPPPSMMRTNSVDHLGAPRCRPSLGGLNSNMVGQMHAMEQQAAIQRSMSAAVMSSSAHGLTNRPAGWLGNNISNRSFNDINAEPMAMSFANNQMDPSQYVPSMNGANASWGQQPHQESQALRAKRDKARRSERRLRSEMDRSRSGSLASHSSNEY